MIEYRTATRSELDLILRWAAAEGWDPGQEDADPYFAADPEGYFVAVAGTEVVASISVVNHSADFAFLGLYIVRPEYRGRGIGFGLWQHAMRHAGDRVIGLDGVAAQQENYKRSGFVRAGGTTRYTGAFAGQVDGAIRPAETRDIDALIAMEAKAIGAAKPAMMRVWFQQVETRRSFVLDRGGEIAGFCTLRTCQQSTRIGPLVTISAQDARALILHAAAHASGPIVVDVPEWAAGLHQLCAELDMRPGFKTARMYKGAFSPARPDICAVASMELG